MSHISLTDLAKRRLLGSGLKAETDVNGDVLVAYDRIEATLLTTGGLLVELFQGRECIAAFEPVQMAPHITVHVTDLEGKLRIHKPEHHSYDWRL